MVKLNPKIYYKNQQITDSRNNCIYLVNKEAYVVSKWNIDICNLVLHWKIAKIM